MAGRDYLIDAFLDAIASELELLEHPHEVDTLYIGGGTPSQLDQRQRHRLVETIRDWLPLAADAEFTIEANPLDVNDAAASDWRSLGVNRISLGVQSFDNRKLRTLERDHNGHLAQQSLDTSHKFFDNVSIDLIFASPGETLEVWQRDLKTAIRHRPSHVSTYSLTFEKGTSFWSRRRRGMLTAIDEETDIEMFETTMQRLHDAGFEHYEISNFARDGRRSQHNEVYWSGKPYLAFGPGAASFIGNVRAVNHRSTHNYIRRMTQKNSPIEEREVLTDEEIARDRLVFGLRRLEGIDEQRFAAETGYETSVLGGSALESFVEQGLLDRNQGWLKLSRRGLMVSDAMWPDLLGQP